MATQIQEYRMEIDNEGYSAKSFFPGITYDDFDRGGGISPWKICRMFEAGRMLPFYHGNFMHFNDLVSDKHRFFVLGGDYYFDTCLWEVTRKYHYFPYKIKIDVIGIGQSSMTIRQVLVNSLDDKEIASYYGKVVYVNLERKKSSEFPYWYREKFRKMESRERVRIDSYDYIVPSSAYKFTTKVTASDIDVNGHTNQASYVRFCMDAAASASRDRALTRLTQDICLYPILKMSTSYRSETVMGDTLVTSLWQDDLSPQIFYFNIQAGGKTAFTSTIKFKCIPCSKL